MQATSSFLRPQSHCKVTWETCGRTIKESSPELENVHRAESPYLGGAGGSWAVRASVTGGRAGVAAVWARQRAGLQAAAVGRALAPVADPSAAMHLARQGSVTNQAAGDVLEVARDVAAFLPSRRVSLTTGIWGRHPSGCGGLTSCFPMHHFSVRKVQGGHFSSLWQLWNTGIKLGH